MMEFARLIERLKYAHQQKQIEKEEFNKQPSLQVDISYDKSRKDIGVLIRLNNLQKRLEVVKWLIGVWKPQGKKYSTMTEQVHYVQRKLELLNEAKILHF